ncbi:MAG: radical SAM protein, partial [archaeon]|nr:radical SAM protein [archaeon]
IALTGGEATTRTDLLELLEYGQNKGFVMGVITNGRKFSDIKFVKEAIKSGLDYVQITLESNNPKIHDDMVGVLGAWEDTVLAIKNFAEEKIFWMTNTTICEKNVDTIPDTIKFLHNLGAQVFAMNGLIYSGKGKKFQYAIDEIEFKPILENILDISDNLGLRFIWYTVTQYCTINPIEMGLGVKRCSAANMSMGIEPDGSIIPCQSYFESVGNILEDDWEKLWNSALFKKIRNHEFSEHKCKNCEEIDVCGGGCPLYVSNKQNIVGHIGHL